MVVVVVVVVVVVDDDDGDDKLIGCMFTTIVTYHLTILNWDLLDFVQHNWFGSSCFICIFPVFSMSSCGRFGNREKDGLVWDMKKSRLLGSLLITNYPQH